MASFFKNDRNYVLGDEELGLLGSREKLAQWRHQGRGPVYYKLGRKIVYRGSDLNEWVEQQRVGGEPSGDSVPVADLFTARRTKA